MLGTHRRHFAIFLDVPGERSYSFIEREPVPKFALKIICPIEFKRIRHSEKAIVQTGPDELEVEVSEEEPTEFKSQGSQTARAKNHWGRRVRCPGVQIPSSSPGVVGSNTTSPRDFRV